MIFESHAHYDDEAFDEDREELLARMEDNEISHIINVGADIASSERTIALTRKYPFVYGAVGVHPDEIGELDDEKMKWLDQAADEEKVVAIGEIGLDYYWDKEARDSQQKWFRRQMELAHEKQLPVIIHSRDAAKDTYDVLKEMHIPEEKGVIHCFGYSKEMAVEFVKLGYYIGIGGVVTFKNAKNIKEAVKEIPLERILVETDSPYLAPVPYRGKRNSSLYLPYIIREIAALKDVSDEEAAEVTAENAKKLFALK